MKKRNRSDQNTHRIKITIQGAVQGVGFRPFVFRLAQSLNLTGWVINSAQGVVIEAEGRKSDLNALLLGLEKDKPPLASIQSLEYAFLDPKGFSSFEVRKSKDRGAKTALILPDIGTCPDCRAEIFDPDNRRYLYPFTNCTNCGPRYSIINGLPYDRPNTTMAEFEMCDQCLAEYNDPANRRFHAQPNACPDCGPHVSLTDKMGNILAERNDAILKAADAIRAGRIAAVKGLGGFHLMADAANEDAVKRLRGKKHREHKPLAMMFPSLAEISVCCHVDELEKRLLTSPESPIVLLRARENTTGIAPSVAPKNPYFGVMLAYTPLHHILVSYVGGPVVATSGNVSEEPICIDNNEALKRLGGICDLFLVHNRKIARHVDDSIVCVRMGRQQVLRRARGFAPLPVDIEGIGHDISHCVAVGAHLKNTVALPVGNNVFVSQHIGDLESPKAFDAFQKVFDDLQSLYEAPAEIIAADLHPDYLSSRFARDQRLPVIEVQHHYAHILSCMAENHVTAPALGIAWDGTGFGPDGTIWGGEFLRITENGFDRVAHFRTFGLPGGEAAVREPRRSAMGLLYEIFGDDLISKTTIKPMAAFSDTDRRILSAMLKKHVNTPLTSSLGRIFDAVAAILGLQQNSQFEGQAAMALEFLADKSDTADVYPLKLSSAASPENEPTVPVFIVGWEPMIRNILDDIEQEIPGADISAKFHNTLANAAVRVAHKIGENKVVLSGGCFQNRYLTEKTVSRLSEEGFSVYWHQRIPPNDGGIALGQAVGASIRISTTSKSRKA